MNNKITIIILIFEENLDIILKCIKSVENFKIIIVDNAGDNKRKRKILRTYSILQ